MVAVEQHGGDQSDDDAAENAVIDLRLFTRFIEYILEHERRHGFEDRLHHQVSDDSGQCGGPVGLAGESDRHTDGEQQREVVE